MTHQVGDTVWLDPHSGRMNPSNRGHFVVVLDADDDTGLVLVTLSSVVSKVPHDDTYEFEVPRKFLRHENQTRLHYVCYSKIRRMGIGFLDGRKYVGRLTKHIEAILGGVLKSPEVPSDMAEFVRQVRQSKRQR